MPFSLESNNAHLMQNNEMEGSPLTTGLVRCG